MPINVCVKKQRTNSYLHSPPSSLLLQGERALAKHPQRGVWQSRKGEKMRENEKLEKNGAESFALKFYWLTPPYSACLGGLIAKPLYKLQK